MWARLNERLAERKTDLRTEILGGITTFATMSYIVVVNPSILGDALGGELIVLRYALV
jgi:AGZA family xanthine/uracil permease-like MFS transporter